MYLRKKYKIFKGIKIFIKKKIVFKKKTDIILFLTPKSKIKPHNTSIYKGCGAFKKFHSTRYALDFFVCAQIFFIFFTGMISLDV